MFTWLFWFTLAFAFVDWLGTWRKWQRIRWITKPGTLVLLIAWFTQVGTWRGPLVWFGLGLVFSLAGDVLLHLPKGFFLGGMLAFFLAHVAYIVGFAQQPLPLDWKLLVPLVSIPIIYFLYTLRVRSGLKQHGQTAMLVPVMGYAGVISLMVFFAVTSLFCPAWQMLPAALVSLGAGFFYLSDGSLAYDRFICPFPASNLLVMVTYHLGQVLIASGALIQYA
jgi:uncharacterized membrane protein YhhN